MLNVKFIFLLTLFYIIHNSTVIIILYVVYIPILLGWWGVMACDEGCDIVGV